MQPSVSSPAGTLAEELDAARRLQQLLKQEQKQLIEADIDGLTALTGHKAALVARMTDLATSRHRALAAAGFPAEEAGMQTWLRNEPPAADGSTAEARKSWIELLALAQSAKHLNRTNGILINTHLARNQTALNVLRGNTQGGNFYGPDGQQSMKVSARGLVVG
jgi:flagella synthesis protein FlgN